MIGTREIIDEATFNIAIARRQAIVLVSPPWSAQSIRARAVVADGAEQLISDGVCAAEDFFVVIGDDAAERNPFWLWLGVPDNTRPPVTNSVAMGAGSVIWLRDGNVVRYEFSANHIGVSGFVNRTTASFAEQAT